LGAFGFDDDARPGDHRGRGPKGYARSDERIREDVSDRLTDDPHVDASEVEVTVQDREVTLSGTVNSRFEKRHAEDIAESVSGVTHVQNNLRVEPRGGLDAVSATGAGGGTAGTLGPAGGPGATGSIE
jgi:osmotically-inducible protein OsmY